MLMISWPCMTPKEREMDDQSVSSLKLEHHIRSCAYHVVQVLEVLVEDVDVRDRLLHLLCA